MTSYTYLILEEKMTKEKSSTDAQVKIHAILMNLSEDEPKAPQRCDYGGGEHALQAKTSWHLTRTCGRL